MENLVLDIFNSDAFSVTELSKSIDLVPIKWGRLGELDIFPEKGIPTTTVLVEYRNNRLTILPTKPRGAPGSVGEVGRRYAKTFSIPHIPHDDTVQADEIQNVRAFGGPPRLESVMDVVNRKFLTMRNKHDITLEHMRAGMMQGKLIDFDGTVLLNLFTEFGVTEPTIAFNFDTPPTDQAMVTACDKVKAWMEDNLLGDVSTGIRVMCSPTFWRYFISNPTVLKSYQLYQAMVANSPNPLRDDVRRGFVWQDMVWEQYRAKGSYENADGTFTSAPFIPDGECRFVPEGTMNTFSTYFGPPTFMEAINEPGLRYFAKAVPERGNRWIDLFSQSNPLPLCEKPLVLIRGYATGGATNI
jgi:hypothetical protein